METEIIGADPVFMGSSLTEKFRANHNCVVQNVTADNW